MDITLQLKKGSPGSFEERGDIRDVWITDGRRLNPGVKYYYIHITGFPNVSRAKARRIRDMLTAPELEPTEIGPDGVQQYRLFNRRRWHIPRGLLPQQARRKLARDGELTVQWTTARNYLRRKLQKILRDDSEDGSAYSTDMSRPIEDQEIVDA